MLPGNQPVDPEQLWRIRRGTDVDPYALAVPMGGIDHPGCMGFRRLPQADLPLSQLSALALGSAAMAALTAASSETTG